MMVKAGGTEHKIGFAVTCDGEWVGKVHDTLEDAKKSASHYTEIGFDGFVGLSMRLNRISEKWEIDGSLIPIEYDKDGNALNMDEFEAYNKVLGA